MRHGNLLKIYSGVFSIMNVWCRAARRSRMERVTNHEIRGIMGLNNTNIEEITFGETHNDF